MQCLPSLKYFSSEGPLCSQGPALPRTLCHNSFPLARRISTVMEQFMKMCDALQNVAQLYNMLRSQAFDLHEPGPRMLPRQFNPLQLNIECAPPSPAQHHAELTVTSKAKKQSKKASATSGRCAASRILQDYHGHLLLGPARLQ